MKATLIITFIILTITTLWHLELQNVQNALISIFFWLINVYILYNYNTAKEQLNKKR